MLRELTFYTKRPFSIIQARQLRRLCGMFRAKLLLINLSRRQQADPEQPLTLLSLAVQAGDLCQIVIEGSDAELAHMVLTLWVGEHGLPLSGRGLDQPPSQARLTQRLPGYHCTLAMQDEWQQESDKDPCLRHLITLLPDGLCTHPAGLLDELRAREVISATVMRPGLAMPHVLSQTMRAPCIAVLHSQRPIDWGSALGPVQLMVLLAAPAKPVPEHLAALIRLSRALLDDQLCAALLRAGSAQARHAILTEALIPAG